MPTALTRNQRSDGNVKFFSTLKRWSKTDYLFIMLASWTSVQLAMCIAEFIKLDSFVVPTNMPFVYFLLLLLYVVKKESDRWLSIKWKKRKGEIYLVIWFVIAVFMFIVEFFTHGQYQIPRRLVETLIWIVVAYFAAVVSIILHHLLNSESVAMIVKYYLKYKHESGDYSSNKSMEKERVK